MRINPVTAITNKDLVTQSFTMPAGTEVDLLFHDRVLKTYDICDQSDKQKYVLDVEEADLEL